MTIKLLHTADWQIGKGFANFEGDAGALLRTQRLKTVERVANIATERQVDVVLVAGDVFETNAVADETLRRTLNQMQTFKGPWVLLPGNHDAALSDSAWTRLIRIGLPDNVKLAIKPAPILLLNDRLAILPAPLARRHEVTDITEWFDTAVTATDVFRVGLAHGSVANRLPQQSEASNVISDTRSVTARLDYLALGDWHGTLEIAPRTWYSGTPEPERFRNNEPGNVLIVTLTEPRGAPTVEVVPVGHFRWKQFEHIVTGEDDVAALDALLSEESQADRLVANLTVRGTVDLATRQRVEELIDRHRARCHILRIDDDELVAMPSDQDLDRIDTMGFVRSAIEELRTKANNPGDSENQIARSALQKLYLEHLRLGD
jgi:DNA repair exonuclease SbcCD nuclease subunit